MKYGLESAPVQLSDDRPARRPDDAKPAKSSFSVEPGGPICLREIEATRPGQSPGQRVLYAKPDNTIRIAQSLLGLAESDLL